MRRTLCLSVIVLNLLDFKEL